MAHSYPSIQSFFERKTPVSSHPNVQGVSGPIFTAQGDGFTKEELEDAADPLNREWDPGREYEETTIGQLVPGPKAVAFIGRIVNISTIIGRSQKQPKAAGWHYLILKDDAAAISLKLYFPHEPYHLRLGCLVSVWTVFVSDATKAGATAVPGVSIYANLFPGRVTSDHVMFHSSEDNSVGLCRRPLDYDRQTQSLPGLMTLASYISGGHDGVLGVKLLVCVKRIGAKRRITKTKGGESELVEVLLFDHTAELRLTLWEGLIESSRKWQSGKTILLISSPSYRAAYNGKGCIGIQQSTMLDEDPEFPDAVWLKNYAARLVKRESVCQQFPDDIFTEDVIEAAEYGINRILFRLADVDEWVRSYPGRRFTGFINVVIMEMSLVSSHRQRLLLCGECCGFPIYANTLTSTCSNCCRPITLTLNSKIIGTLLDETGSIAAGQLVWSERAWGQLLGRSAQELTEMSKEEVKLLEQRMLFLRMHLVFGWDESLERLAILGVKM